MRIKVCIEIYELHSSFYAEQEGVSCCRITFDVQPKHPSTCCEAVLVRRLPPVVTPGESAAIFYCRTNSHRQFIAFISWLAFPFAATTAVAGGGPENLLLVVKPNSE